MDQMTTSFVHNSRRSTCAALVAILALAGFSCRRSAPPIPEPPSTSPIPAQDAGPPPITGDAGTPSGLPTRWATYRNEALGIEIPYPEGWYVRTSTSRDAVRIDFNAVALPPENVPTEAVAAISVTVGTFDLEDAVRAYSADIVRDTEMIENRSVTRVRYRDEFSTPNAEDAFEILLWKSGNKTIRVSGMQGDPLSREMAQRMLRR